MIVVIPTTRNLNCFDIIASFEKQIDKFSVGNNFVAYA